MKKPEISYAEFPFVLKYEKDGAEKIIKDIIICKYLGIEFNTGNGLTHTWDSQLSMGEEYIVLWEGCNKKGEKQIIYYNHEQAGYFMGDPNYKWGNKYNVSNVALETYCSDGSIEMQFLRDKKLLKKYGIKIIDWECAPPIENTFE